MVLGPAVPVVVLAAEAEELGATREKREREPPERRVAPAVPEDLPRPARGASRRRRAVQNGFTAPEPDASTARANATARGAANQDTFITSKFV